VLVWSHTGDLENQRNIVPNNLQKKISVPLVENIFERHKGFVAKYKVSIFWKSVAHQEQ